MLVGGAVAHVALRRGSGRQGDNPLHVPDGDTAARAAYLAAVREESDLRPNG